MSLVRSTSSISFVGLPLAGLSILGLLAIGCDAGGNNPNPNPDTDSGIPGTMDGGVLPPGVDGGPPPPVRDAGPGVDPFDQDGSCGAASIPTTRVPGSLLILFDRSSSMDTEPSGGGGSRWDQATAAVRSALTTSSDDLGAGLLFFPTGSDDCGVDPNPGVSVAPLSSSRAQINTALTAAQPEGGKTPLYAALAAGYDHLGSLSGPGQRGVVLVTDGAETCDSGAEDATLQRAADEFTNNGYLTFVVGLTQSNNVLSTLAFNGGTPRSSDCLPMCQTDSCMVDADCTGGGSCTSGLAGVPMIPGVPGMCSCTEDSECPGALSCEIPFTIPLPGAPVLPGQCEGDSNCCHFDAQADTFQADFEAALGEITQHLSESCIFELPRGDNPDEFDPNQVNVGVTFSGEPRTVLRRSSDATQDSWDYTDESQQTITIQGSVCERLLSSPADVEIVLGCPTILI